MVEDSAATFVRLSDGVVIEKQADGSYKPTTTHTDFSRIDAMSDAEIERIAGADADHPGLDETFWALVDWKPAPRIDGFGRLRGRIAAVRRMHRRDMFARRRGEPKKARKT